MLVLLSTKTLPHPSIKASMGKKTIQTLGFTLVELMTTVSIAAILLGVAIPNFTSIITNNRMTAHTNELVTALNLARSEAIKRGQQVVVRKSGTNWEDGWQVFVDIDRDSPLSDANTFNDNGDANLCEANEDCLLRTFEALPSPITLRGNNNFVNFIRYQTDGLSNNIGSFVLCNNASIVGAKLVIVNRVGRVRQGTDADGNGIPEKADNSEISSCTDTTGF
jgi:type IV fimbrial biogenesis protein FimT